MDAFAVPTLQRPPRHEKKEKNDSIQTCVCVSVFFIRQHGGGARARARGGATGYGLLPDGRRQDRLQGSILRDKAASCLLWSLKANVSFRFRLLGVGQALELGRGEMGGRSAAHRGVRSKWFRNCFFCGGSAKHGLVCEMVHDVDRFTSTQAHSGHVGRRVGGRGRGASALDSSGAICDSRWFLRKGETVSLSRMIERVLESHRPCESFELSVESESDWKRIP